MVLNSFLSGFEAPDEQQGVSQGLGNILGNRQAALLCFFPTSHCSVEKGFASSSPSHHLHPAATHATPER